MSSLRTDLLNAQKIHAQQAIALTLTETLIQSLEARIKLQEQINEA